MPISEEKKWYQEAGIKKPHLQIKILRCIGLEGQLSKRMAEKITMSDYSDVSNAIDSLKKRRIIKINSFAMKGRRDKRYFALTEKGLKAFIDESYFSHKPSSEEFWKAIIWYCMLNPEQISFHEIEKYCSSFESKYLGHPAINSYIFQSQFFDKLVNNWLKENGKFDNNISILQKILECLAINRNVTLQQLCQMTAELKDTINEVLGKHTVKPGYISNEQQEDANVYTHSEDKRSDLGQMLIVRKDATNHAITYELSLFGIILTIALIRYHHTGIDNVRLHIFNGQTNKLSLFFKNISLNDYFDKIASNYHDKLPLIFEKWSVLKKELGHLFLYDNFDFLLYTKAFSVNMGKSIWQGGNKEFCDNLQALADKSVKMLKVLYIEGIDVLKSFIKNKLEDKKNEFNLLPIYLKLNEIETILRYSNNESFSNGLEEKISVLQNKIKPLHKDRNLYPDSITFMERIFSNELTFFFYLNLNNIAFTTSKSYSQNNKTNLIDEEPDVNNLLIIGIDIFSQGSPKQRLIRVLQNDDNIKQHFYTWMNVLMNYQQETSEKMLENFKMINNKK